MCVMPIYEYECLDCGERFEILQRMGEGAQDLTLSQVRRVPGHQAILDFRQCFQWPVVHGCQLRWWRVRARVGLQLSFLNREPTVGRPYCRTPSL